MTQIASCARCCTLDDAASNAVRRTDYQVIDRWTPIDKSPNLRPETNGEPCYSGIKLQDAQNKMVLTCTCGCRDIEIKNASYPEDANGNPAGIAVETYECAMCGRTGTFRFGDDNGRHVEETSGCVTTTDGYL